ncbi:DUF554 domain-containing protein [Salsuginibacillus kocurii]|uniref:DUF554 domain-containing protein n=1 Tax=Salsuginibacillus kocurii TaxID=427078 RepID=UPI000373C4BF|nr:DUF554 domain-containing protein [Salsuginibacillus kocurii]
MVLLGTLVNGAAIIVGCLAGLCFRQIPEHIKTAVMQVLALCVVVLGIDMALESEQFIVVIASLAIGAWIGERLRLEDGLNRLGEMLEERLGNSKDSEKSLANGFVTATLIYVVGAMAVIGALDSGLRLEHDVLFTKSLLDGFTALLFTTTLGIGVIFSAIPVVLYQGTIALFAEQIDKVISEEMLNLFIIEMTSVGGVMIIAIGLRIAGLLHIRVANLLPAIVVVALVVWFSQQFGLY